MVLDIIAAGIVLFPVTALLIIRSKAISIMGPTLQIPGSDSKHIESVGASLDNDEQILAVIEPNRGRWVGYVAVGVLLLVIAWGIALLIHGLRIRNRSAYVFTDKRVVVIDRSGSEKYSLDEVKQLQTGQTHLEQVLNRGHVQFSLGGYNLKTVNYLRDPERVVSTVRSTLPA